MPRGVAQLLRTAHRTLDSKLVLLGLAGLTVAARCTVLYAEAYSFVLQERLNDEDLIRICREGTASRSPRMRTACLEAQSDRSSPAVVKAFQHAAYRMAVEVGSFLGAPLTIAALCLLAVLFGAAPCSTLFRAMAMAHMRATASTDAGRASGGRHAIVVLGSDDDDRDGLELDGHYRHPSLDSGACRARAALGFRPHKLAAISECADPPRAKWL